MSQSAPLESPNAHKHAKDKASYPTSETNTKARFSKDPRGAIPANITEGANLPPLPWLAWMPGERVVVRYRLADGLHDALGALKTTSRDYVEIETRRGLIRVDAETMVTGKKVPPHQSSDRFRKKTDGDGIYS